MVTMTAALRYHHNKDFQCKVKTAAPESMHSQLGMTEWKALLRAS